MIPSLRFIVPATLAASAATAFAAVYQGNGIKVGEVTAESAVIWTRLTAAPEANWSGIQFIPPSIDGAPSEAVQIATAVAKESGGSEALARAQKTAAPKRPISQAQLREIVLKADWRSQLPAGRTLPEMHGTLPGAAGAVRVVLDLAPFWIFPVDNALHPDWQRSHRHLNEVAGVIDCLGQWSG